jgi:hypothetical protein
MSETSDNNISTLTTTAAACDRFEFPRWANYLVPAGVLLAIGVLTYLPLLYGAGFAPETTSVGYQPVQPVPFSHKVHVGNLNMDCRYCHTTVDKSSFAAIPPTQTCMNCHAAIKSDSEQLKFVRDSYSEGTPINWIKIHDLPDFVYFNHSAHVNRGVACVECHGRIDQMDQVYQSKPISMAWCLECHRKPEDRLRPREQVTNMEWDVSSTGQTQRELGAQLKADYHIRNSEFMTSCTTCHR